MPVETRLSGRSIAAASSVDSDFSLPGDFQAPQFNFIAPAVLAAARRRGVGLQSAQAAASPPPAAVAANASPSAETAAALPAPDASLPERTESGEGWHGNGAACAWGAHSCSMGSRGVILRNPSPATAHHTPPHGRAMRATLVLAL
jgi:hypothetical protein